MKKIISMVLICLILMTSLSFAYDNKGAEDYIKKSQLDGWGLLALYGNDVNVSNLKMMDTIEDSNVTTDYERYLLGKRVLNEDVKELADKIISTQMIDGKFSDYMDGTGDELVNAHIWGIISLYVADQENYDKEEALSWLRMNQYDNGGFGVYVDSTTSATTAISPDLTAMGAIAYKILGLESDSEEITRALKYVDDYIKYKEENSQGGASAETISWQIIAKTVVGKDVEKSLVDNLLSYKLKDGTFKHFKTSKRSNYMATYHAMLALSDYERGTSIFDKLHNKNKVVDVKENSTYSIFNIFKN